MITKYRIIDCIPYQKCPCCDNGIIQTFTNTTISTTVCNVCNGTKIIPMYQATDTNKYILNNKGEFIPE